MIWQARISRPRPQTNSYLFRAKSNTDIIEICWLLPPKETWKQYEKGNVCDSELVRWSIDQYMHNSRGLAESHPEDLPDHRGREIYLDVVKAMKYKMI
jgi:hypothetical protein